MMPPRPRAEPNGAKVIRLPSRSADTGWEEQAKLARALRDRLLGDLGRAHVLVETADLRGARALILDTWGRARAAGLTSCHVCCTLASVLGALGDFENALDFAEDALAADTLATPALDVVAAIRDEIMVVLDSRFPDAAPDCASASLEALKRRAEALLPEGGWVTTTAPHRRGATRRKT